MRKMGKGLEVQGSGFGVRGSGFGVSPRDGMPLDCVRKLCSNEKLEMRNGDAAHKNQKRRGVSIALRAQRHFDRSPRSLLQNAHRLM